jgi:alpha-L-rhamnosidase
VTQATGKLETPYGELVSQWKHKNGTFDWTVVIPPNTSATVHLPVQEASKITLNGQAVSGSVHEVEAGEYHFVVS